METRAVVAQTTLAVIVPGFPDQGELETVTFRGFAHGRTRKIVFQYAGPQHLFISGAEVDESKIARAGETDAGETGAGCWNTFPEEERALFVEEETGRSREVEGRQGRTREVNGLGERPTLL